MQGKGIGRSLIQEVVDRMKPSGKEILYLNVNRYNKEVSFYERLGFLIVGEEENAIGKGFFMNDYVMALTV